MPILIDDKENIYKETSSRSKIKIKKIPRSSLGHRNHINP